MKHCLVHANTYARLKSQLPAGHGFQFITIDDEGAVTDGETGEPIVAPDPVIAFGNGDVWFGPAARPFFKHVLSASAFDWFQSSAAGVDNAGLKQIIQKARLYTTNHKQAEAMAEWALWQALDWMRRGPEHRANQREAIWESLSQREIMGSNWLIIGYGSIGKAVARRVTALGGLVTGVRRSGGSDDHAARIVTPDQMMAELPKADVVLLSMPHTPETENMANADFFAAMEEGKTLFLNLGRGALVDEAALIAEMDRGRPVHAALDVTATEPLPEASPLWYHPGIMLTPHDSPDTPGTLLRADETFLENFGRYVRGEPLLHVLG